MTEYSDRTLEETPLRVTQFLTGLATDPAIRTLMASKAGMSDADVIEGAELLRATFNLPSGERVQIESPDAQKRRLAVAELDAWDEPNFTRIKAALDRHFPEQAAYVFRELGPSHGFAAVRGVGTLLTRLDALERGTDPARKDSAEADRAAVALLAKRGITSAVRWQLQELVSTALSPTEIVPPAPAGNPAERRRVLAALRAWFDEWSSSARVVLTKRAHRIRMGLATRRSPSKPEPDPPAEPEPEPEPEPAEEGGSD
ncbi:MAG TPA: hypothetical protein VFS00_12335 [Polyangiaceae bacterium]|nr:hypothetical protein [Polyangiaceae bacterium]